MKTLFLIIFGILFLYKLNAQSPQYAWIFSIGGHIGQYGNAIKNDDLGNVYITGSINNISDFDPGPDTFNLTATGWSDLYIAKYNSFGNFIWAKSMGGSSGNAEGKSLTIDSKGSIYLVGNCFGTVDFDPGPNVFNLTSSGHADFFVCKLDSSGNFIWANSIGEPLSNEIAESITIDASENLLMTGEFGYTVDFDMDSISVHNLTAPSGVNTYVLKFDTAGNFIWAKSMGGNYDSKSVSIATDKLNAVYTVGYFEGSSDFNPDSTIEYIDSSAGGKDLFISKLDSSGNFRWAVSMGGMFHEDATSITIDSMERIFITGGFESTIDFDPDSITSFILSAFGHNIFILSLDTAGHFRWVKALSGIWQYVYGIAHDDFSNLFITGVISGNDSADFDPGPDSYKVLPIGYDGFVAKYDSLGNFRWVKTLGGTDVQLSNAIAVDHFGNAFATGNFRSDTLFCDSTFLINADIVGQNDDIFILKIDTTIINKIEKIDFSENIFKLYPNPTDNYFIVSSKTGLQICTISFLDIAGKLINTYPSINSNEVKFDIKNLAGGIYFVQIQSENYFEAKKLIVEK